RGGGCRRARAAGRDRRRRRALLLAEDRGTVGRLAALGGRRRGRRRRRLLLRRRGGLGLAPVGALALAEDHRDRLPDRDALALLGHAPGERAGVLRLQLEGHLVRLDLGDRLAQGDRLTLVLEPLEEGPLLHG